MTALCKKDDPTEDEETLAEALRMAIYKQVAPEYPGLRVFAVSVTVVADTAIVSANLPDNVFWGSQKFTDLQRLMQTEGVAAAVEKGKDEFFRYRKVIVHRGRP